MKLTTQRIVFLPNPIKNVNQNYFTRKEDQGETSGKEVYNSYEGSSKERLPVNSLEYSC
jgi:hypothetical protein